MATSTALRSVLTPEGVPIEVELADHGARAGALLIDLLIIIGTLLIVGLVLALAAFLAPGVAFALLAILSFLLRCPFFIYFELRWRGQTPGKRVFKLRVVDRRGGALSPRAVAARNVTREVEVFMPVTLLLARPSAEDLSGMDNLLVVAALVWLAIFVLMPLFTRDRLRIGDMVAGTWVVRSEPVALLRDLTTNPPSRRYRFTAAHLDVYGIAELQVLERLLRQPNTQATLDTKKEVLERILDKIAWPDRESLDRESFLNEYYAALRAHLEQRALFGDRRADKDEAARRR
ncbi:MAG: RDD family protein, partial [Gammaproteobacteria bacterium]|nr:RDD family protein [Gammaproteobacteria bacterium]